MRTKLATIFFIALCLSLVVGCENPKLSEDKLVAWEKAHNESVPNHIVLQNGSYWHSGGITNSWEYFFQIEYNDSLWKLFMNDRNLRHISKEYYDQTIWYMNSKPDWFASKGLDAYQIWTSTKHLDHLKVYKDTLTQYIFWSNYKSY